MHTLFILSLLVLAVFFLNRRKLSVLFTKNRPSAVPAVIEGQQEKTAGYNILAYNAKDFNSTKELEDAMELRLEKCITGLAKQGHKTEVEFHSTGFVLVYIVKYWY